MWGPCPCYLRTYPFLLQVAVVRDRLDGDSNSFGVCEVASETLKEVLYVSLAPTQLTNRQHQHNRNTALETLTSDVYYSCLGRAP
jgi:hypothetical protein